MNTIASLDTAFRDFKYALRTLGRTPGFTVIAILTLALGIGANTAIFTLLDQVLLRLLPVKNPAGTRPPHHARPPLRQQLGRQCHLPSHVPRFSGSKRSVLRHVLPLSHFRQSFFWRPGRTRRLGTGLRYLLLHSRPQSLISAAFSHPRTIAIPDGHPYIVLNYDFWKTRFSSDPEIVGKTLTLNNNNMTVVGVLQPGFDGVELGRSPKLFVPIMMQKADPRRQSR